MLATIEIQRICKIILNFHSIIVTEFGLLFRGPLLDFAGPLLDFAGPLLDFAGPLLDFAGPLLDFAEFYN
jgi:hypothetical protein